MFWTDKVAGKVSGTVVDLSIIEAGTKPEYNDWLYSSTTHIVDGPFETREAASDSLKIERAIRNEAHKMFDAGHD